MLEERFEILTKNIHWLIVRTEPKIKHQPYFSRLQWEQMKSELLRKQRAAAQLMRDPWPHQRRRARLILRDLHRTYFMVKAVL